jgi:hypothetical protein
MLEGKGVQLVHRHVHERGHLVDESSGPARAGAVHPFLQGAAEEDDLGVLAAQFDYGVGMGYVGVDRRGGGVDFLDEIKSAGFGYAQPRGTGHHQSDLFAGEHTADGTQDLGGSFPGLGIMTLIGAEQQLIMFIQHHHLDGRGADVNSDAKTQGITSYSWLLITITS